MMRSRSAKSVFETALAAAGIRVDGDRPWDLRVHDERLYERVLSGGSLAAGEAYMDGWWDAQRLDQLFERLYGSPAYARLARAPFSGAASWLARLVNRQTPARSRQVAEAHYNLSPDVFRAMLGRTMCYTCAYWDGARDLDEAEEAKLELVCRKLELSPGMTVLELGCGWGSFAKHAAERHGVSVVGLNIAKEQVEAGRELCRGLPVELRVQDYREASGLYDRVVSIGIMEHVGPSNYRRYMETAAACLKDDGLAFVHTITGNVTSYRCDPWFDRYIFPNGVTPSLRQISAAAEGLFVIEDVHNIGPHYDPTLMAWHENLSRAWTDLRARHGERFLRMMRFYLLSAAATFRARQSQVFQLVLSKARRPQPRSRAAAAIAAASA